MSRYLDLSDLETQLHNLTLLMAEAGAPHRLIDRLRDAHAAIDWTRTYIERSDALTEAREGLQEDAPQPPTPLDKLRPQAPARR